MFSMNSPKPTGPDDVNDRAFMFTAVGAVAERSFFAVTEPCDEGRFRGLADAASGWLLATVQFRDGPFTGYVSCTVPDELARLLFDALTGREPTEPAPTPHEIADLIGEFSNMVCGAWLSRVGSGQIFEVSRPVVGPAAPPTAADPRRLLMTVNDFPLAIDRAMRSLSTPCA